MAPTTYASLAQQARDVTANTIHHLGPLAAHAMLQSRDGDDDDNDDDGDVDDNNGNDYENDPHSGSMDYHDINNTAVFVIFGLIGAAFVITGIWFFFWAKNGGFYFRENDWEDYKTTVLRRKGPNGTLLSGATPSTNLGGGSVYKEYKDRDDDDDDDARTAVTGTTGLSGITAGASDIAAREKRDKKRKKKEKEREARRAAKNTKKTNASHEMAEEDAEREAKAFLREYRHERPARVGGLNKQSEASEWDGSTNPADSTVSSSLLDNREGTPTSSPAKDRKQSGGIRKVYSTADKTADRENERIRAEARRLAERGRSVAGGSGAGGGGGFSRRNFSYQRADSAISESDIGLQRERIPEERSVPGSWEDSEVGTKSYTHTRNLTGGGGNNYADEKRKNRRQAAYRRDR